jgi:hypothetical protein
MEEKIKPSGTPPDKWWLMKPYIDEDGKVFMKGQYDPSITKEQAEKMLEEKKATTEPPKKEEKTFTAADVDAMVSKKFEELIKQLGVAPQPNQPLTAVDIAKAVTEASMAAKDGYRYFAKSDLGREDIIPKGQEVTFFAHGNGYGVNDYFDSNGIPLKYSKDKMFNFKPGGRKIYKDGKEESIKSFCTLTLNSYSQVEFVKGHPKFNLEFFTSAKKAMEMDQYKVQQAVAVYERVSGWDKARIIEEAMTRNLDLGQPLSDVQKELAAVMANEYMEQAILDHNTRAAAKNVIGILNA